MTYSEKSGQHPRHIAVVLHQLSPGRLAARIMSLGRLSTMQEVWRGIEGKAMRLIRLYSARGCFRVSTWLAIVGARLADF